MKNSTQKLNRIAATSIFAAIAYLSMFLTPFRVDFLTFDIKDAVIYYAGPTQAKPGEVIGSIGPTTSGRMDPFAPRLLDLGLVAMIGKGGRAQPVVDAIIRNGGVLENEVVEDGVPVQRYWIRV